MFPTAFAQRIILYFKTAYRGFRKIIFLVAVKSGRGHGLGAVKTRRGHCWRGKCSRCNCMSRSSSGAVMACRGKGLVAVMSCAVLSCAVMSCAVKFCAVMTWYARHQPAVPILSYCTWALHRAERVELACKSSFITHKESVIKYRRNSKKKRCYYNEKQVF